MADGRAVMLSWVSEIFHRGSGRSHDLLLRLGGVGRALPLLVQSSDQRCSFVVGHKDATSDVPRFSHANQTKQAAFFKIIVTAPAKTEPRVGTALRAWKELRHGAGDWSDDFNGSAAVWRARGSTL